MTNFADFPVLTGRFQTTSKELSLCHKLWLSTLFIFATQWLRPYLFQTMNSDRWKNLSLKYQRFTPSGEKNMGIRKSEFVTKTQFLYDLFSHFIPR